MSYRVPQYTDPLIRFSNLHYNTAPTGIDLSIIDNFICSISHHKPDGTIVVQINSSASGSRFDIDNANKLVDVQFYNNEIGNDLGCYWANLWLIQDNIHLTHYSREFEIVRSVPYS